MSNSENEDNIKDGEIGTIERYAEAQETKITSPDQVTSYYYDEDGTEPIPKSDKPDINIDIKIPKPTLQGESSSAVFYIKNNLERNTIELMPFAMDKHVTFSEYPKELKPQELGLVRLTFSPTYRRYDALNTMWGFNYALKIVE